MIVMEGLWEAAVMKESRTCQQEVTTERKNCHVSVMCVSDFKMSVQNDGLNFVIV